MSGVSLFTEGYDCAQEGGKVDDCPYIMIESPRGFIDQHFHGGFKYNQWMLGFERGLQNATRRAMKSKSVLRGV